MNAQGGVAGRTFEYRVLEDHGDPTETLRATRQLVQSDHVFAIVSPGGEQTGAVRQYLNRAGVPQLFVVSCASALGREAARYPWTIGFQPSCHAEGRVYGRYLAAMRPAGRVAVLFRDDGYGRELLEGLRRGIARSGARVVAVAGYDPVSADVAAGVRELRATRSGVLAVFAPPEVAVEAHGAARRLGWRPVIVSSAISGSLAFGGGERRGRLVGAPGSVAFTFLKDPAGSREDVGTRLYRSIMSRYAKGSDTSDFGHMYGMAVAHETVELFRRLGRNPSRVGLMAAARSITSPANPFLLPGVAVRTGPRDGFPVEQGRLQRWTNGRWAPFGGMWSWDGR